MKPITLAAVVITLLHTADAAWCVPPDEIRNSPIPPLKAPPEPAARQLPVPPAPDTEGLAPPAAGAPASTALPNQGAAADVATPGNYPQEDEVDYDAQRAEIWNSPVMREARKWVMEYARRSAQSSEQEGRQFLGRLSQLSPDEMRSWLQRYQEQRARLSMGRAVEQNARQLAIENSARRQEARRQAFVNINAYQSLAAAWASETLQSRGEASQELRNARAFRRDATVRSDLQQNFDPFWPIFDPASPRGDARYWAASSSLPGDLPAGDPRNRVVDVVDIDGPGPGTVILEGGGTVPNTPAAGGGDAE